MNNTPEQTKRYGCFNKDRPVIGSPIRDKNGFDTGIRYCMSTECRYDNSLKDSQCKGCVHAMVEIVKEPFVEQFPGKLIVLEGIDGSGKTTQANMLVKYLQEIGYEAVYSREPGTTTLGMKLRELILNESMDPLTELFLFASSRIENIQQVILPKLRKGAIVVCDRFIDSTYAYQGYGRNLLEEVLYIEKKILKLVPEFQTVYLDISLKASLERLDARTGQTKDRLDNESLEFKEKLIKGYQESITRRLNKVKIINGEDTVNNIEQQLKVWVNEILRTYHFPK